MKDLIRRRATYRRVRPDLVVPVFEPHQDGAESTMIERDALVPKPLFLEGADEPFLDGNAAMPTNCTEPGANLVVVAPFDVLLAEPAVLITDGVLGRASGTPGRIVKHNADLVGRRSTLESSKAEGAAGPVVDDDGDPEAEGPGLGEGEGEPTRPEARAGRNCEIMGKPDGVAALFERIVTRGGAEGIVVHASDGRTFKVKPEISIDAAVIGYLATEHGISELLLALITPSGRYQSIGRVRTGWSKRESKELGARLAACACDSAELPHNVIEDL